MAFHVEEKNGNTILKSENKLVNQPYKNFILYSSYPLSRGLDHPNEISAYMFSEFLSQNIILGAFHEINESSKKNRIFLRD